MKFPPDKENRFSGIDQIASILGDAPGDDVNLAGLRDSIETLSALLKNPHKDEEVEKELARLAQITANEYGKRRFFPECEAAFSIAKKVAMRNRSNIKIARIIAQGSANRVSHYVACHQWLHLNASWSDLINVSQAFPKDEEVQSFCAKGTVSIIKTSATFTPESGLAESAISKIHSLAKFSSSKRIQQTLITCAPAFIVLNIKRRKWKEIGWIIEHIFREASQSGQENAPVALTILNCFSELLPILQSIERWVEIEKLYTVTRNLPKRFPSEKNIQVFGAQVFARMTRYFATKRRWTQMWLAFRQLELLYAENSDTEHIAEFLCEAIQIIAFEGERNQKAELLNVALTILESMKSEGEFVVTTAGIALSSRLRFYGAAKEWENVEDSLERLEKLYKESNVNAIKDEVLASRVNAIVLYGQAQKLEDMAQHLHWLKKFSRQRDFVSNERRLDTCAKGLHEAAILYAKDKNVDESILTVRALNRFATRTNSKSAYEYYAGALRYMLFFLGDPVVGEKITGMLYKIPVRFLCTSYILKLAFDTARLQAWAAGSRKDRRRFEKALDEIEELRTRFLPRPPTVLEYIRAYTTAMQFRQDIWGCQITEERMIAMLEVCKRIVRSFIEEVEVHRESSELAKLVIEQHGSDTNYAWTAFELLLMSSKRHSKDVEIQSRLADSAHRLMINAFQEVHGAHLEILWMELQGAALRLPENEQIQTRVASAAANAVGFFGAKERMPEATNAFEILRSIGRKFPLNSRIQEEAARGAANFLVNTVRTGRSEETVYTYSYLERLGSYFPDHQVIQRQLARAATPMSAFFVHNKQWQRARAVGRIVSQIWRKFPTDIEIRRVSATTNRNFTIGFAHNQITGDLRKALQELCRIWQVQPDDAGVIKELVEAVDDAVTHYSEKELSQPLMECVKILSWLEAAEGERKAIAQKVAEVLVNIVAKDKSTSHPAPAEEALALLRLIHSKHGGVTDIEIEYAKGLATLASNKRHVRDIIERLEKMAAQLNMPRMNSLLIIGLSNAGFAFARQRDFETMLTLYNRLRGVSSIEYEELPEVEMALESWGHFMRWYQDARCIESILAHSLPSEWKLETKERAILLQWVKRYLTFVANLQTSSQPIPKEALAVLEEYESRVNRQTHVWPTTLVETFLVVMLEGKLPEPALYTLFASLSRLQQELTSENQARRAKSIGSLTSWLVLNFRPANRIAQAINAWMIRKGYLDEETLLEAAIYQLRSTASPFTPTQLPMLDKLAHLQEEQNQKETAEETKLQIQVLTRFAQLRESSMPM